MCFVFKTAVVFLCKERLRQKKKSLIVSQDKSLLDKINSFPRGARANPLQPKLK